MFKDPNERYMTSGIAETIHPELAFLLWNLIDRLKEKQVALDYLQVFKLSVKDRRQLVIHRQERPPIKQHWLIKLHHTNPITSTIWCMDNGVDGQMMMFPADY